MSPHQLARQTTTRLVVEALETFGPLPSRMLETMLDEPAKAINGILSRLLLDGRVRVMRAPDCRTVMFATRRAP